MAIDSDSDYASSDDESEVDETEFTCENVRVAPGLVSDWFFERSFRFVMMMEKDGRLTRCDVILFRSLAAGCGDQV
jgi:hypothetical protein